MSTETNWNCLFFTVDSLLKFCCQPTVDVSMLNQRCNNVVNQPLMCQRRINNEIMLSIHRWCVNVESTMMQHWWCSLTIYQHINIDSTLFQSTVPAETYTAVPTPTFLPEIHTLIIDKGSLFLNFHRPTASLMTFSHETPKRSWSTHFFHIFIYWWDWGSNCRLQ